MGPPNFLEDLGVWLNGDSRRLHRLKTEVNKKTAPWWWKILRIVAKVIDVILIIVLVLTAFAYGWYKTPARWLAEQGIPKMRDLAEEKIPPEIVDRILGFRYVNFPAPASVDPVAWQDIVTAVQMEPGCPPELIYGIWAKETHVVDCSPYRNIAGPNPCKSYAGAEGVDQFMPATAAKYPDLDIWVSVDAHRATCRETKSLDLWSQPSKQAFIQRFAGLDGGPVWNRSESQASEVYDTSEAIAPGFQISLASEAEAIWDSASQVTKDLKALELARDFGPVSGVLNLIQPYQGFGYPLENGSDDPIKVTTEFSADHPAADLLPSSIYGTGFMFTFPVKAACSGRIEGVIPSGLSLTCEDGVTSFRYYHLADTDKIGLGEQVVLGQTIAIVDGSIDSGGKSTGTHLHFEAYQDGIPVDPLLLIASGGTDQRLSGDNLSKALKAIEDYASKFGQWQTIDDP